MGWIAFMMGIVGATSYSWNIIWAILYVSINIGLMAMQWHIGPGVAKWIETAPIGNLYAEEDDDEDVD